MNNYQINLTYDQIGDIIVDQLYLTMTSLQGDIGRKTNIFLFNDHENDDKLVQEHIDALKLLLKWYAHPDRFKELGIDD